VREDLFDLVRANLDLPKGNKSFNESYYGNKDAQRLGDYIKKIMDIE